MAQTRNAEHKAICLPKPCQSDRHECLHYTVVSSCSFDFVRSSILPM